MNEASKYRASDKRRRGEFTRHLLNDIEALKQMLDAGMFESGIHRLGAEQEFCLIDYALRPWMKALPMLDALADDHFTTELARFNLELNLDPLVLGGDCLAQLENDLVVRLTAANRAAHRLGGKIILTGIVPTIRDTDLSLDKMTPRARYRALNDALTEERGGDFRFSIRGIDELIATHDNVLFEACNTSFQVHYQISPEDFRADYNWAQAIAGPVLAAATNSPLFLGKRLWHETRIALFQQSTDARPAASHLRRQRPRVTFGRDWERAGAVESFRESVARFRVLLTPEIEVNALDVLAAGEIPALTALAMHNGTVYKWNRLCYGAVGPHLRIECRYLPAGPSIVDEVASAAFWLGLMHGRRAVCAQVDEHLEFDAAKANFMQAARLGLDARFVWLDGRNLDSRSLILDELLPVARSGLEAAGVNDDDIEKYLGIIDARVRSGRTGSKWMLESFASLRKDGLAQEALVAITEGIYQRQKAGLPVHRWDLTTLDESGDWRNRYWLIEQFMSTDLITVRDNDLAELAKNIMLWSEIHHIPVESADGTLTGLVSLAALVESLDSSAGASGVLVRDVMERDVLTVAPDTTTLDALRLLQERELSCLPVLRQGKLVGIVTERDYARLASVILESNVSLPGHGKTRPEPT